MDVLIAATALAPVLGVRPQAVYQAVARGLVPHYSCVYSES